jgi:phosphoribosylformylglycinamidine synthase PurS subunit
MRSNSPSVAKVRQGKVFDVELDTKDRKKAEADLKAICEKLLANTVIEDYAADRDVDR